MPVQKPKKAKEAHAPAAKEVDPEIAEQNALRAKLGMKPLRM